MSTITSQEIMKLYKKCGANEISGSKIQTTINTGTLKNKLNDYKLT